MTGLATGSQPGRRVVVIGAGIVGMAAASYLQRDGHQVTVLDSGGSGEGASLCNAGCLNGSSVVPVSMPGTLAQVPRWLFDPLGPLAIRWRYLPALVPWLWRFVQAGQPERVREQAKALRSLLKPSIETYQPLLKAAGAEDLLFRLGHLFAYASEPSFRKDRGAMDLRQAHGAEVRTR